MYAKIIKNLSNKNATLEAIQKNFDSYGRMGNNSNFTLVNAIGLFFFKKKYICNVEHIHLYALFLLAHIEK